MHLDPGAVLLHPVGVDEQWLLGWTGGTVGGGERLDCLRLELEIPQRARAQGGAVHIELIVVPGVGALVDRVGVGRIESGRVPAGFEADDEHLGVMGEPVEDVMLGERHGGPGGDQPEHGDQRQHAGQEPERQAGLDMAGFEPFHERPSGARWNT